MMKVRVRMEALDSQVVLDMLEDPDTVEVLGLAKARDMQEAPDKVGAPAKPEALHELDALQMTKVLVEREGPDMLEAPLVEVRVPHKDRGFRQ